MEELPLAKTRQALKEIDYIELMSKDWRIARVRFGSMCSYFFYAETQVMDCEAERQKFSLEFKPTKHHSCAIAAYGHMCSCLRFLQDVAKSAEIDVQAHEGWMQDIIYKRDRLQAHPNEKNDNRTIMVHQSQIDGDEITFPLWDQNLQKAGDRIHIRIHPRKDLNILAGLLEKISEELLKRYLEDKASKPHLLMR